MQKIIAKARHEIEVAQDNDCIEDILEEYGVVMEEDAMPVNPRQSKILVVGALAGKLKDYQMTAKKIGIPEDSLEFEDDYDKLKHFNTAELESSMKYSDVIWGPTPHKQMNMGDTSSMLAEMKNHPDRFPRILEATSNGELKISISSFRSCIKRSRLFESL